MRPLERAIRLLKISFAAGLSWYLARLVSPNGLPYFAPLAVVLTFQTAVADTVVKGFYRCAGIVGGVALALLIGHWLPVGPVAIALGVLLGLAIGTLLDVEPQITSQVGVSVIMMLASSIEHYAEYRLFETLLGAVVAVVVNALLMPSNALPQAEERVLAAADLLAASLLSLTYSPNEPLLQPIAKEIEQGMSRADQALRAAEASFKWKPFTKAGQARLAELATVLAELTRIGIQVRGVARGLKDLGPRIETWQAALNPSLKETAEAVAAYRQVVANPSAAAIRTLELAVARGQSSQTECLTVVREAQSLADLRDLSAVLANLNRILIEVSLEPRKDGGLLARQRSVAIGHD